MELETSYLRAIHQYGFRWGKENGQIINVMWDKEQNRAVLALHFLSDDTVDLVPMLSIESGDFVITSSQDPWPATN